MAHGDGVHGLCTKVLAQGEVSRFGRSSEMRFSRQI